MAKKSRNQQVPVEKTPEPWPPITNGPATTAHSATAQAGVWRTGDGTREPMRHNEGIFLMRSEIRQGIEPETLMCYSGASTIWAEDLSQYIYIYIYT
jgi:hypothetical protein